MAPGMIYAFAADILFGFSEIRCHPQLGGADRSAASRDYPYISIPMAACCHCARTVLKHTDPPPATFHMCCSHHSANIQRSLLCCPPPPLPFQAGKAVVSPSRIAQHRGKKKMKESPFKSSSCPASRKVSLPTPQIKDTDVKLMPHLISAKKPRGFKTFIHLQL